MLRSGERVLEVYYHGLLVASRGVNEHIAR